LASWRKAFDEFCQEAGIVKRFLIAQGCVIEKMDGTRFQLRNFASDKRLLLRELAAGKLRENVRVPLTIRHDRGCYCDSHDENSYSKGQYFAAATRRRPVFWRAEENFRPLPKPKCRKIEHRAKSFICNDLQKIFPVLTRVASRCGDATWKK
jgi:hypothetical protein